MVQQSREVENVIALTIKQRSSFLILSHSFKNQRSTPLQEPWASVGLRNAKAHSGAMSITSRTCSGCLRRVNESLARSQNEESHGEPVACISETSETS